MVVLGNIISNMFLSVIVLVMFLFIFECMCLWVYDHAHTTLYFLLGLFILGIHFSLSVCLCVKCCKILQSFLIIFVFLGSRRWIGGHARDLGFVYIFCRPSLFIYMLRERLSQKFWLNSLSFVLFCLAMLENKSSIDGHHVKPVLGLGHPSCKSLNHSIGSDSFL